MTEIITARIFTMKQLASSGWLLPVGMHTVKGSKRLLRHCGLEINVVCSEGFHCSNVGVADKLLESLNYETMNGCVEHRHSPQLPSVLS